MRAPFRAALICGGVLAAAIASPSSADPTGRRTSPPRLALRPEVSEGEWAAFGLREQLSPSDLMAASARVVPARRAARAVASDAAMAPLRERNLQDASSLASSSLDRPLSDVGKTTIEVPTGLDLIRGGFRVNQAEER